MSLPLVVAMVAALVLWPAGRTPSSAGTATWSSAAGKVPFYTSGGVDERGYGSFAPAGSVVLEDGTSPSFVGMHPQWKSHGWITGDFALSQAIALGERFRARIGFVRASACNCGDVMFVVQAVFANGIVSRPLVSRHDVQSDGRMFDLDVDLSKVRGATTLRLRVEAGNSAVQDWAVWVNPRIEGSHRSVALHPR
jgi:hypothetical protein